jgi:hypothetical protein
MVRIRLPPSKSLRTFVLRAVERAVKMAMAMREAAARLIADWRRHSYELGFGAGIAQGYAALTRDQMDFGQGLLHVTRLKRGVPSVHPLGGEELRALRRCDGSSLGFRRLIAP